MHISSTYNGYERKVKKLKFLNIQQLLKHFEEYFQVRRAKLNICGLVHFLSPSLFMYT